MTRPARPTLLSPASLVDPRKRGLVLARGVRAAAAARPEATLSLAGGPTRSRADRMPSPTPGVRAIEIDDTAALVGDAYARRLGDGAARDTRLSGSSWSSRWLPGRRSSRLAPAAARRSSPTNASGGCSSRTTPRTSPERSTRRSSSPSTTRRRQLPRAGLAPGMGARRRELRARLRDRSQPVSEAAPEHELAATVAFEGSPPGRAPNAG